jgi:hypothetical protein
MSFNSLPTELHLHILAQLDLVSLLKATAANRYFHGLMSNALLKNALLAHEHILLEAKAAHQLRLINLCQDQGEHDQWRVLTNDVLLPFYNCLRIKNLRNNFHEYIEGTKWRLCGEEAGDRLCIHCDVRVSPVADPFVMRVINDYRRKNMKRRRR